ncbi:MAG TPA: hypothetical protein VG897_14740 [Terriglobales bacterium]|nr:hypothetical protein [Terriglobales bacterium]
MKKVLWLFVLSLCVPVMAQEASQFAGTWEASFQGKTFFTLSLVADGDKLSGLIVHDNFNLDQQGNISEIEPRDAHERVMVAHLNGKTLDIRTHDDDASESGHYQFTLVSENQGELKLVFSEPPPFAIKPWTLKRRKS